MAKGKKVYLDKEYRLADNRSGEAFLLKTGRKGNLLIFDESKGRNRAIRHCPNQKSIFLEEQDEFALVEPIIFLNGYLKVKGTDVITQEFLDAHPSNVVNGGGWFEPIDLEKEAKESIRDEELRIAVKTAILEMSRTEDGIHELSAVAAVMRGSVEDAQRMGMEELKRLLFNEVEANLQYFIDEEGNVTIFNDDYIKRKYLVLKAIRDNIIKKSTNGRSILWAKDSKVIATAPRSTDLVDHFTEFLTTDDGMLVLDEIIRRS